MDPATTIVVLTGLLGLYMAWNIGANDVANSMADAVGSGAISVRKAVIAASLCEFAGAVLVGAHVTDTVRKGIVNPQRIVDQAGIGRSEAAAVFILGMAASLLAAAVWLHIATRVGVPVSTTHSIVGAIAGFGIVATGWSLSVVNWDKMGKIVASWFISPIAGGVLAFITFKIISGLILGNRKPARAATRYTPYIVFATAVVVALAVLYKGLKHLFAEGRLEWLEGYRVIAAAAIAGFICAAASRRLIHRALKDKHHLPLAEQLAAVERVFAPLVVITSCSVAFAHGANDVANSVGPLAAVADMAWKGAVSMEVDVPTWILVVGGSGIVIGLATYGYRVMRTVGQKITQITPSRGVAADIAATVTVLACSRMGLPVSTTHTLVGAIIGIGLARGFGGVNMKTTGRIFASWFITVPAAAVLAVVFYLLGRHFLLDHVIEAIG
jgi:PiT family inorganic phosphate transporter